MKKNAARTDQPHQDSVMPHGPLASVSIASLVVIVYFAIQIAATYFVTPESIQSGGIAINGYALALALIISAPLCTGMIWMFMLGAGRPAPSVYLGLIRPPKRAMGGWIAVTVCVMAAFTIASRMLGRPEVQPFMRQTFETAGNLPLLFLGIGILGPVFEEALFRGFLFKGLASTALGRNRAMALSTLFWVFIHLQYDIFDLTNVLALGIVFGLARLRTGSLYVSIAAHVFNNLAALAFAGLQLMHM